MKKGIKDLIIFGTVVTLMTTTGLALKKHFEKEPKYYESPKNNQEEQIDDIRISMALTHNDGTITYLVESDTRDFSEYNHKVLMENLDNITKIECFDKDGNKPVIESPFLESSKKQNGNFDPTLARVVTNKDGTIDFLVVENKEKLKNDYSIEMTDEMEKVEYFDEYGNILEEYPPKIKTR